MFQCKKCNVCCTQNKALLAHNRNFHGKKKIYLFVRLISAAEKNYLQSICSGLTARKNIMDQAQIKRNYVAAVCEIQRKVCCYCFKTLVYTGLYLLKYCIFQLKWREAKKSPKTNVQLKNVFFATKNSLELTI